MITSVTETHEGITYIFQSRKYKCKYVDLRERRVIKIGKDWVKTGAWRIG
jgi:hypothetical protein